MHCKHCGTKNFDYARFCKSCGKEHPFGNKKFKKRKFNLKVLYLLIPALLLIAVLSINSGNFGIYPLWPTGKKVETLTCSYKSKNLKIDVPVYGNVSNYYKNLPNQEKYLNDGDFSKFVYTNPKDKTVSTLSSQIYSMIRSMSLGDDQALELATCFVQNIPYDNQKYEQVVKIAGNTADTEQFPYETLYNNKGICTDKAYLGSAVLKEMGYGTAIMYFPNDHHMSLGISVPSGYTSFNSNYAIMDVTSIGFTPGNIPASVGKDSGVPDSNINNLKNINEKDNPDDIPLDTSKAIGPPSKVITVNTGKSYTRIVTVKNLENEIINLYGSLAGKKANLQSANSNISNWNSRQAQAYSNYLSVPSTTQSCYPICSFYPYYSCRQNCTTLNNPMKNLSYSTYSTAYNNYKNAISNYNNLVNDYNNTLTNINKKINTYKTYEY